jgi:hypothetical protein
VYVTAESAENGEPEEDRIQNVEYRMMNVEV